MTWLERDSPWQRLLWKSAANARAVARIKNAQLDAPDAAFRELVQAAVETTPIRDAHNIGAMDVWDYREWVNSGGRMTINATTDTIALAVLCASLTRIPPKT